MKEPGVINANDDCIDPDILPEQGEPRVGHGPEPELQLDLAVVAQLVLEQSEHGPEHDRVVRSQSVQRNLLVARLDQNRPVRLD